MALAVRGRCARPLASPRRARQGGISPPHESSAMSSQAPQSDPVLVEILRGDLVESRHRGAAAIVDAAGIIVASWGDVERPVFAGSALKPLQSRPRVGSRAADHYRRGATQLTPPSPSHPRSRVLSVP